MPHAQRIYTFTILYTIEGQTRTLGERQVVARDDLEAYTWLCNDEAYRALATSDILSVYMKSYWVTYAS